MLVRFWGVRGSHPCPGPTTLRYGGNTACVEIRTCRDTLLVLDCGSGAAPLGKFLMAEGGEAAQKGHLLISHTHWDHIQGLPFFSPLFGEAANWNIYGPRGAGRSLESTLAGQMASEYFPISLRQLSGCKKYHDLTEGLFRIDDVVIRTRYLNHPALTLGYRIEADDATVVYIPDHEPHHVALAEGIEALKGEDDNHRSFMEGADLVIHDAQYTFDEYREHEGWGHCSVEYAVDIAQRANVARLALFHHDPDHDDLTMDAIVAKAQERVDGDTTTVVAAQEGETIVLHDACPPARSLPTTSSEVATAASAFPKGLVVSANNAPEFRHALGEISNELGFDVVHVDDYKSLLATATERKPAIIMIHTQFAEICSHLPELKSLSTSCTIILIKDENGIACANDVQGSVSDWISWPCSAAYLRSRLVAWSIRSEARWLAAPKGKDEVRRLEVLHSLSLLDTEPEGRFDRLTKLTAELLSAPMAAISLVDRDRQWMKSRFGFETLETSRDQAYCAHTINSDGLFVVPDAMLDDRFAESPMFREERHRFYAGVPLQVDGQAVGALCVMDRKPREFSEQAQHILSNLAAVVQSELKRGD